jgi:hypothetical protein
MEVEDSFIANESSPIVDVNDVVMIDPTAEMVKRASLIVSKKLCSMFESVSEADEVEQPIGMSIGSKDSLESSSSRDSESVVSHKVSVSSTSSGPALALAAATTSAATTTTSGNSGGLKVYLRVRAIPSKLDSTITVESNTSIVTNAPETSKRAQYNNKQTERSYTFSHVFAPTSQQTEVFDVSVGPLLEKFLRGESTVLFAYGMTNAGKTYTIQGSQAMPGILPRLVNAILDQTKNEQTQVQVNDYRLQMSMLEIYQEKIYDLLATKREKLSIRDGSGKVEVGKLSVHAIASADEALKLLGTAAANRYTNSVECSCTVIHPISNRF